MLDLVLITLRASLEEIKALEVVEAARGARGGYTSTIFFDAFLATLIALLATFLASLLVVRFL